MCRDLILAEFNEVECCLYQQLGFHPPVFDVQFAVSHQKSLMKTTKFDKKKNLIGNKSFGALSKWFLNYAKKSTFQNWEIERQISCDIANSEQSLTSLSPQFTLISLYSTLHL